MKLACLSVILVVFVYQFVLNIIDLKSAENPVHERVKDIYDADAYQKWRRYKRDQVVSEIAFSVVELVVTLLLLSLNAFSAISTAIGDNIYLTSLGTVGLYIAVDAVIGTVRAYVDTMVIEEKYGFNKTKPSLFVKDRIKSLLLSALLIGGLLMLFVWIYQLLGNAIVLVFAAILMAILLLVVALYPFLSKLSNKFELLEDGELKTKLTELLTKHGYTVKSIEVMKASERTTKSNAYFAGAGKTKTIVLYDNLIEAMSTDEIVAVFAHELGHGLHKDTLKLNGLNLLNVILVVLSMVFLVNSEPLYGAFGFTGINYGFAFIMLTYLFLPFIGLIVGLIVNAYSRRAEYKADEQAVAEGYGADLIGALKKLAREDFADLAPAKIIVLLIYSHPPLLERILNIEARMKEQNN